MYVVNSAKKDKLFKESQKRFRDSMYRLAPIVEQLRLEDEMLKKFKDWQDSLFLRTSQLSRVRS